MILQLPIDDIAAIDVNLTLEFVYGLINNKLCSYKILIENDIMCLIFESYNDICPESILKILQIFLGMLHQLHMLI